MHPDLETNVTIQDAGAPESVRNAVVNLPEGMFGNPNALPKCTSADFALVPLRTDLTGRASSPYAATTKESATT